MEGGKFKKVDVAWAAGYYEGEGTCFATSGVYKAGRKRSGEPYVRKTPIHYIHIVSNDKESLERFRDVFGLGYINGPYLYQDHQKGHWKYSVGGFEKVQAIIAAIWPWLSSRRKQQLELCLRRKCHA